MSVLSRLSGGALVALAVVALSVVACTPTDSIRPIEPGWDDEPRAPVTLPSESFYFREWSYVGSGAEAREVQAFLHGSMEAEPSHRAIIAGADGAEYHGVVNRWHHEDGRVAYVPAAMYVRGQQIGRFGELGGALTGRASASFVGGLAATGADGLIGAQGDVDPTRAWVVVKDGLAEWTAWKPRVPGFVFSVANLPVGPLAVALLDENARSVRSVKGGPPWLAEHGDMRVVVTNPPRALTLLQGDAQGAGGWSISIRRRQIGDSKAYAVLIEAEYGQGDTATRWLSRISLAPLADASSYRTRGSVFLPDGGEQFQKDGVVRPFASPRTRADRVALARILQTVIYHSNVRSFVPGKESVSIRWVSDPRQIPPPVDRVPSFPESAKLRHWLGRYWVPELSTLSGTPRDELLAIADGLGRDPAGAASYHRRTIWLPHDADVQLIAHELMHLAKPRPYPPISGGRFDQLLAAYLHDEGATEAAARELLGWPRIADLHIVPVSAEDMGRTLLDLTYGYAPAVPGILSHTTREQSYGARVTLERGDEAPLVSDRRGSRAVAVPFEMSAAEVLRSEVSSGSEAGAVDALRVEHPSIRLGIVPLLATVMQCGGKHWGLSSLIDSYRGDMRELWFEGENEAGITFGDMSEGARPLVQPSFLGENEILRIYAFAPRARPVPSSAAPSGGSHTEPSPHRASQPNTTLTIDQVAELLRSKRGLTVLHGKTDEGVPVIGIRLKWKE